MAMMEFSHGFASLFPFVLHYSARAITHTRVETSFNQFELVHPHAHATLLENRFEPVRLALATLHE